MKKKANPKKGRLINVTPADALSIWIAGQIPVAWRGGKTKPNEIIDHAMALLRSQ